MTRKDIENEYGDCTREQIQQGVEPPTWELYQTTRKGLRMNNMFISSAKKDEAVENFVKSKRKELEKMVPIFVDDRSLTDIVLNFYERGIRDGVQMMLERMTDIIAARNATHVSAQMSEASASGKLNDVFNEKED